MIYDILNQFVTHGGDDDRLWLRLTYHWLQGFQLQNGSFCHLLGKSSKTSIFSHNVGPTWEMIRWGFPLPIIGQSQQRV